MIDATVDPRLGALVELDAELDRTRPERRSLGPGRARAHGLVEILAPPTAGAPDDLVAAFVDGTCGFVRAMVDAFPDNLLWDLDLPLCTWWRTASAAADPVTTARDQLALAAELQALFGRRTVLHFRYAHDFLYGFDWAKWVGRDPQARGQIGPFDWAFLQAMRARGHELVALVTAGGDAKYPALAHAAPRNPFRFSREPAAELAIHHRLADAGRLPVPAWQREATVSWTPPWAAWREQVADELGHSIHRGQDRDDVNARGA